MTRPALFDTAPRRRRARGPTGLVPAPPRCPRPSCSKPLVRVLGATQPSLFYGLGYGAVQRTVLELCHACGWTRLAAVATVNPRHLNPTTKER